MRAYTLSADNAVLFWELCHEFNLTTEEKRVELLEAMAKLNLVKNIVESPKSKEEYIQYLAKHFKILNLKDK